MRRQIVDIETAVGQPAGFPFDVGKLGVTDDDPFEPAVNDGLRHIPTDVRRLGAFSMHVTPG